nr:hypothetical protein CFP56_11416 [Quercus suber]
MPLFHRSTPYRSVPMVDIIRHRPESTPAKASTIGPLANRTMKLCCACSFPSASSLERVPYPYISSRQRVDPEGAIRSVRSAAAE